MIRGGSIHGTGMDSCYLQEGLAHVAGSLINDAGRPDSRYGVVRFLLRDAWFMLRGSSLHFMGRLVSCYE